MTQNSRANAFVCELRFAEAKEPCEDPDGFATEVREIMSLGRLCVFVRCGTHPGKEVQGSLSYHASRMMLLAWQLRAQTRELQRQDAEIQEIQRKQALDSSRVNKIFENQKRLRENIKSMEHVRTGSLLERYMNDMDKEENDLIATRKRMEESEETVAKMTHEASRLMLQIIMKTKQLQKKAKCR